MTITVTTPTTIIVQDPSARGAIGPAGPTGPTGPAGPTGATGAAGAAGDRYRTNSNSTVQISGGYKTFQVDSNLSYTVGQHITAANTESHYVHGPVSQYYSSNGTLIMFASEWYFPAPDPDIYSSWDINLAGIPGPDGANGASANVQVGNVITGAEGSSVTITNVGNTTNVILDFSIPRGNTGNSVNLSSVTSNVIPSSNNTYNLGSPQYQWKDLYVSNNTIYMGNVPLSIDANGALRVNGSIVSSANTGNISFQNNIVVGTGVGQTDGLYLAAGAGQVANLQYLRLRGGDDDAHIHFDTANTEAYDFYFGDDSKYVKLERGYNGNVVIGTYGGDGFKTWNFASNGNLTLPGQIHGFTTYGGGGIPNGRVVDIVPADDASDKKFKFRIDQYAETFTRAYFEMPEAQNDKQVAIAFPHANGNTGYIYTQGADAYDDGLNNAFNIFYNSGDIKVTAMTPGTGVYNTWKFGGNGALTFPDNTVQSTAYTGIPTNTANVDILNTNGLGTTFYVTFVENRDVNQIVRGDVDLTYRTDINALGAGILKIAKGAHEKYQAKVDATGVVTHDCANGHIFYHTSPDSNWTANFTNLNLDSGYATALTLVISQGGTGYYPSAVQIGGVAQTINWQGNTTPSVSTNRTDVVTFSVMNDSSGYIVLGQLTGF